MTHPTVLRLFPSILLLAAAVMAAVPAPVEASELVRPPWVEMAADTGTLTITGSGSVRVPADHVRLRFAMETVAPSAREATDQIARAANLVLEALRPMIGPDDRLETTDYQLNPTYAPRAQGDRRIDGYRAANTVLLVSDDVDEVGALLDAAIAAGANRVSELTFFTVDDTEARTEAIAAAVEQARMEAEVTAAALGVRLGDIRSVHTNVQRPFAGARMMAAEAMRMDATPIEVGSSTIDASVTVTWGLLPAGDR